MNKQTNLFDDNDKNLKNEFDYLPSKQWTKKELLLEEFKSLGFYIFDVIYLNEYGDIFNQLKIISYKEFLNNNKSEALVAGTVMSIQ